jgi:hypothetical protein
VGICTDCSMARAECEDIPRLINLHREILARHAPPHRPIPKRTPWARHHPLSRHGAEVRIAIGASPGGERHGRSGGVGT